MSIVNNLFGLILTISLLVAIHEFGHYIVARMCGIKVLRFSIGFGKPIWLRRAGADQTEYCISALPLGGYVKMLDEREGKVTEADRGRSFNAQPVWQRIAVLLAGPAFNFFFAIFAYWLIFVVGMQVTRPVVGVVADDSPAAVAGLEHGDVIVAVGERTIESWQGGLQVLVDELVDDAQIPLTIERVDGRRYELVLKTDRQTARLAEPGKLFEGLGFKPWSARPVIGDFSADSAARDAGLQIDDQVLAIDGEPVRSWNEMAVQIQGKAGVAVALTVLRDGNEIAVDLTPREREIEGRTVGLIGVTPADDQPANLYGERRLGVFAALPAAVSKTADLMSFTLEMFGRMISGSVSTKNISGPLNIAEYAGFTLDRGFVDFVDFLALVSVSLGVLNLLPVPMLDGGQIVYQAIEGVTGKPVSERLQVVGQQIGIVLLLGVMSLAFYNDIARLVSRAMT